MYFVTLMMSTLCAFKHCSTANCLLTLPTSPNDTAHYLVFVSCDRVAVPPQLLFHTDRNDTERKYV